MANIILHHYPISPYAEKIRLMFGYLNSEWHSVIHKPVPPREVLDDLAGGYRRIPVLQIGADIYCDTRIIVDELAERADSPELSYSKCDEGVRAFCDYVEGTVFMPIIGSADKLQTLKVLLTQYWPWQIAALMKDRQAVTSNAKIKLHGFAKRREIINEFKSTLSEQLGNKTFLFDNHPTLADFCAYHLVWFANKTQPQPFFQTSTPEDAWLKRMANFGHGEKIKSDKKQALSAASQNKPNEVQANLTQHDWIGRQVSIAPNDYATDSITGKLVGADETKWIVKKESSGSLITHIHLPTTGFEIALLD